MALREPDLCQRCGGKCCQNIRTTRKEFDEKISRFLSSDAGCSSIDDGRGNEWVNIDGNCPALGEDGCKIKNPDERPIVCQLYPFIPIGIPSKEQGFILLLAVSECRYWGIFGCAYEEAEQRFRRWLNENKGA